MVARERSLRDVVNMWLGSDVAGRSRVTRITRSRREAWRCVCVESEGDQRSLKIMFFRHDDGCWFVFPPAPRRPAMGVAVHAENRGTTGRQ
ncbi:hypothetical protein CA601_43665 [Paraburkholderia hospita]|nr:hypothetical protein CA602_40880 [Paraburkholderia hospita]OUL73586.1 hypothetical protein CA601_43665 [Paraburkholderia hospita]